MKRTLTIILALAAHLGFGQSLEEYLQIRHRYGIQRATTSAALEVLVGQRVTEVAGFVKGVVKGEGGGWLYLQTTEGADITIHTNTVSEWLTGGEVAARLIVKAERATENSSLHAELLGAAREEDISRIEAKSKPKSAAKKSKQRSPNGDYEATPPPGTATRHWDLPANEATPYYANFIAHHNKKLPYSEAYRIAEGVIAFSIKFGVDARLIMAMMICESDFRPNLVSKAGAMGLGQLMPDTVREYGIKNPFDSVENVYGTVREIRSHLDRYQTGDEYRKLVLGLAAYNAGPGAVKKYGGVPPYRETQGYVKKVVAWYRKLCGK